MWCSTCQQETPGVAHATTGRIICSRCQQPVTSKATPQPARICDDGIALDEQAVTPTATLPKKDDWDTRERVRSMARELRRPSFVAAKSSSLMYANRHRLDPPQNLFGAIDTMAAGYSSAYQVPASLPLVSPNAPYMPHRSESSQVASWLTVTLGLLTLAAGVGLIAWSLTSHVMTYWNLALGLSLGGQGALILGLVLVVSRLWRHSKYAAGKLIDVHSRLGQLQQTADVLTTMRSGSGSPAFYADLARGASPQMLLTNLKGQLDQLATRLGSGM